MSAEILRRAAASMRERAEDAAAVPGLWNGCCASPDHAAYVASWPPAVALAVADWLDSTANDYNLTSKTVARAFAVARTYLGESA
jgi:hypothetical protein